MAMTAKELHALAPLGATVTVSDGKPMPPARFTKKLAEWKHNNFTGRFVHAYHGDPSKPYRGPTFTLQPLDSPTIVANRICGLDGESSYDVTPPAPGTVMPYSDFQGAREIKHVWRDMDEARAWHVRNRYEFGRCGYRYLIVAADGSLVEFEAETAAAAMTPIVDKRGTAPADQEDW